MSQPSPDPGAMSRDELEAEVQSLRGRVDELESTIEEMQSDLEMAKTVALDVDYALTGGEETLAVYVEENPPLLRQLEQATDGETLADLREDLVDEQKKRSRDDARLRRRIGAVAEAAGVDVEDSGAATDDRIQRLIRNGVDAVTDRPYPVHERARAVLLHAGEWGTVANDAFGGRILLEAPAVRERLELHRDENLQSRQVIAVFEKIAELAADSDRTVQVNSQKPVTRLRIQLSSEELDRL